MANSKTFTITRLWFLMAGCLLATAVSTSALAQRQLTPKPEAGPAPKGEGLAPMRDSESDSGIPDRRIGIWSLRCLRNKTRAEVDCFAVNRVGYPQVRVWYVKPLTGPVVGPQFSAAPVHDCPGQAQTVRVDEQVPDRLVHPWRSENSGVVATILKKMERGRELRAEGYTWPRCYGRSETHSIEGFAAAHVALKEMISQARP